MPETVTWSYNGSNQLVATVTGATNGEHYRLQSTDPDSTTVIASVSGGSVVLTVTDIGGLSAGDTFTGVVQHGGPTSADGSPGTIEEPISYGGTNVFTYGTSSTTGTSYATSWSYDGSTAVSVTFVAEAGVTYDLVLVTDADVETVSGGPYTAGTSHILTTNISPGAGEQFGGFLVDDLTSFPRSTHLFVGGTSGAGFSGNPQSAPGPPTGDTTGGTGPGGIRFLVKILDHDGHLLATLNPVRDTLKWTYRIGNNGGPGDFSVEFALSETDTGLPDGTPLITRDLFAPYRTDWVLEMIVGTDPAVELMGGICTGVNLKNETGTVVMTGKDWLHWLEQPYPFTEVNVGAKEAYELTVSDWLTLLDSNRYWNASAGTSTATITYNATQHDVVDKLIRSLGSLYDGNFVQLAPVYIGGAWAQLLNYQIPWGDATTVLGHLQAISKLYDPRGFDFWVDANKTLMCQGPRAINPSFVTPAATLNDATNIVAIDWTNNGPLATETIAFGSGFGNGRPWFRSTYGPSVDVYRRWKRNISFTNPATSLTSDNDVVTGLASAQGYLDRFPQKELRLTIKPDKLFPTNESGGYYSMLGEAIRVTYDFAPYHLIDADFFITSQTYYTDAAGNALCDLTLDQIYGTISPEQGDG